MAKIILDAGHGGADPGAVYEGRQEKDDNLRLALAVGDILEDNGVEVAYTRTEDVYDTPLQKAQKANREGGDFFVSFHRNSSPEANQYSGVETLVYDRSGKKLELAEAINEELSEVGFRNLGVKERPGLIVLRRTEMPAVLVETGFLNTDADNLLFDEEFDQIAQAIADGILLTLKNDGEWADSNESLTDGAGSAAGSGQGETKNGTNTSGVAESAAGSGQAEAKNGTNTSGVAESAAGSGRAETETWVNASKGGRSADGNGLRGTAVGINAPEGGQGTGDCGSCGTVTGANAFHYSLRTAESGEQTQEETEKQTESELDGAEQAAPRIYRVQTGAFRNCANAQDQLYRLLREGFPSYILLEDGYYRVQTGAYLRLDNAVRMEEALRKKGYSTFLVS